MSTATLPPDLLHAARFAELLGRAVPHAASLEEALAAVDLALGEEGVALGMDAQGQWHGPTAPGPGWVVVGQGPQGGKIWRQQAGAAPQAPAAPQRTYQETLARADAAIAQARADREARQGKEKRRAEKVARRRQFRQSVRAAVTQAFGQGATFDDDFVRVEDSGRNIDLEVRPASNSVFVQFTQEGVAAPSAKQEGRSGWDVVAQQLQPGTAALLHRFQAFVALLGKAGAGVEYDTTEPRRARLYAKVLTNAGFVPAGEGRWLPRPAAMAFAHDLFHRKAQGILNRAVRAMKTLSGAARAELKQALSKKDHAEVSQALVAFVVKYRDRLASLLSATQLAALLGGAGEVAAKLPPSEPPRSGAVPAPPGLPPEGPFAPSLPEGDPGRVQLPLIEEASRLLAEKDLVTRPVFDRLDASSRAKAFTVAGVTARETLGKVRDVLAEVVEEGADLETFRDRVLEEVEPGTFMSDAHMETVFRTSVQGAFSDGQYGMWQHPVIQGGFPYTTYDAIHDDRVRDNHLALEHHGIDGSNVYRTDDPVFQMFRPPWDYNDRCGWTLITVKDAAARGVKEAQRWLDTGQEPSPPAFVPMPPFRPPPGFVRPTSLSLALADEPLEEFVGESSPAVALFTPIPQTPGENQGGAVYQDFPEKKSKSTKPGRRVRRKLARKLRVRRRWRKTESAPFGMVGDEWHGPKPPGEGWVPIQPGPRGGKRWKRGAGAPPLPLPEGRRALPAGVRPTVEKVEAELREAMRQGKVGDYLDGFATKLGEMTVKDIQELKKRLGLKASGPKAELARKIIERAKRESELQVREAPVQSQPYQRPQQPATIDKTAPVEERIRQYAEGAEKVKRLASSGQVLDHWTSERHRLQGEVEKLWDKRKSLVSRRLGKQDQAALDRLHLAIRQAAREENQAASANRGLLGREFAAADPPDLTYVLDDDSAAITSWQDGVKQEIARANSFLTPLVERAGAPDTLPAAVRPLTIHEKRRAYYQNLNQTVHLAPDREDAGTVVHEWGHHLEKTLPGASEACREFLAYRMKGEKPVRFKQLNPHSSYEDDEEGIEDDFTKAFSNDARYVGKIYKGGYTEILSMGLEKLYNDPAAFARADPEYCAFVLGILDGRLRK